MVEIEKVSRIYNPGRPDAFQALREVSLQVRRGEMVVLKGPSGSGKTSLLSLIGCMARPTAGRIVVGGKDVAKLPERFLAQIRVRTFGFIFQQFNLIRDIGVLENILLPLFPLDMGIGEMQERGRRLLERFGLEKKIRAKVGQLSGGEQQRVAIARALINDPEIIIADEPTAHLDSKLSADLLRILEEINRSGKTIIIATHDPLVYDSPAVHRLVGMHDGRIVEDRPQ